MKIKLTQPHFGEASRQGELTNLNSWIKSFVPRGWKSQDLKYLGGNLPNNAFTHSGLIYYLHACWAKELGCVLRPDMIYFTVLSEIAGHILKHPNDFKSLFTNKNGKEDIIVVDPMATSGHLDIHTLCEALRHKVVNKEMYQLICDTTFDSDDSNAREARCMTFCEMGIPYYNYLTTLCGITSIDVQGSFSDWKRLFDTVGRLRSIMSRYDSAGQIGPLLEKTFQTVSTIIHYVFDPNFTADSNYPNAESFFNDIFHYGSNAKCGSGHDAYIVSGWARHFYMSHGEDITNFSPSMTYVPYLNIETKRKFVQVSTLAYSDLVNGTAIPHYGKILFEVVSDELFNKIAMKTNNDPYAFAFDF
jgi:hypothetical protein